LTTETLMLSSKEVYVLISLFHHETMIKIESSLDNWLDVR